MIKKNAMISTVPLIVLWITTLILTLLSVEATDGGQKTIATINKFTKGRLEGSMMNASTTKRGQRVKSSLSNTTDAMSSSSEQDDSLDKRYRIEEIQRSIQREIKDKVKQEKKRARELLKKLPQPRGIDLERVSADEFERMSLQQKERGLSWFGDGSSSSTNGASVSASVLSDPSQFYDKWAQAYRMLGGFIDCDHDKSNNNDHHSGDNNNQQQQNQQKTACSRWMVWASVSFAGLKEFPRIQGSNHVFILSFPYVSCCFVSTIVR
jgi:hypothetical protein